MNKGFNMSKLFAEGRSQAKKKKFYKLKLSQQHPGDGTGAGGKDYKGAWETSGGEGYIHNLPCDYSFNYKCESCLLVCYLYLNKAVFKIEKARRISTIIFLPVSKSLCNVNLQLQEIKSISPSFESGVAYGMCWKWWGYSFWVQVLRYLHTPHWLSSLRLL